ncbi:MAG: D-alanyl-D-alanine carboxypeptidase, partial [Clostridia bacterium]|nr:D-alanyl-D-alanine carboxypeptidase [Clostridia bacterium]
MRQRKLALALVLALAAQLFFVPPAQAQGLKVEGKGAILIEAAGGDVLFAQDEDTKWYPASVTKVMTL